MYNFSELTEKLRNMNFATSIETIEHNGVLFPEIPEYITKNYGKFSLASDKLSDLATRQLFGWASPRAIKAQKENNGDTFSKNFYSCLKLNLTKKQLQLSFPKDFEKLRSQMTKIIEKYSEDKKEYNKIHKQEILEEREEKREKYGTVIVNGEPYTFNPTVEAGGIFYGRGDCSYHGGWALDVTPEDVMLNSSKKIPCTVKGHHWKEVTLKPNTFSPCTFDKYILVGKQKVHIVKSIRMSNDNPQKKENDLHKFDKARLIEKNWSKILKAIKTKATSDNIKDMQIGCCAYLIALFGIRAGNESGKRENGVRGASTLLVSDVELLKNNQVHLNFIGKDSMEFDGTQKVDSAIYDSLEVLQAYSKDSDEDRIFPDITSGMVNKFFQGICPKSIPDLSCKNFRTYYGTSLLVKEIQKRDWDDEMTDKEFKSQYDKCVLEVAKKLNHKKTISKEQSEKISTSSKEKIKKAKEKFINAKEKALNKIEDFEDEIKVLRNEQPKNYLKEIKLLKSKINSLKQDIEDAERMFKNIKQEQKDRVENQDTALGTSKSNYSSPKVAYSLAKYCDKNPKIILSPALTKRFDSWINMDELDENYWMNYPNVD